MSSKINTEFVDSTKIKSPGTLPKGMLSQFLAFVSGNFDPLEEMELMQATIPAEELNSSYTDINNTTAVVGGLVIAFCFSATQTRFTSLDGSESIKTIWASLESMKGVEDVYGLLIGLALVFSFFAIIYSMFMTTMLAQMPKDVTNQFFELVGIVRIQVVFTLQTITLILFLLATLLQISVNYSAWVSITILVLTFTFFVIFFIFHGSVQVIRIEVLRKLFYNTQTKKKDNRSPQVDGNTTAPFESH